MRSAPVFTSGTLLLYLQFTLFTFVFCLAGAQTPQGFTYQALAVDAMGDPIRNQSLPVRITIQSESNGGTIFWFELFDGVTTNATGFFNLVVGMGTKISGTADTFADIDWTVSPKYIKTEIHTGSWQNMGASALWSVPYAMTAGDITGSLKNLKVAGENTAMDVALFEVKNTAGKTVFAVYNEGVRVYVGNGESKASKGGFAIGGFDETKESEIEYLRVTRDSTRINVNQNLKSSKGGFAIGGFDETKYTVAEDFLNVTPENTFIGHRAGISNTDGLHNSFIGYQAGKSNTSGNSNIFLGYNAGYSNTLGTENIFIGSISGYNNVGDGPFGQGSYNIFMGSGTGHNNLSGLRNIFIGYQAGSSNISGGDNLFLGMQAGFKNSTGGGNIFMGPYSGFENTVGVNNLFIGAYTGENNIGGTSNLYLGTQAGQNNQTGSENVAMGHIASMANTNGSGNTVIGVSAAANRTGSGNVIIGTGSGQFASAGSNNVLIGHSAGQSNGGNGNIFIGYNAGMEEYGSNRLYINNSYSDSNTSLIYGEFDNQYLQLNATVKIKDVLKLQPRATPPENKEEGDMYYDSSDKKLKVWDGTAWRACW